MNIEYQPEVIRLWEQQGCLGEMRRRLGYRLRLADATIPSSITAGRPFELLFTMVNDGWAAPFNPRALIIALRHANSGRVFTVSADADPRRWLPGDAHRITARAELPADAPAGEYEVLFNLPDPHPDLYNRAEYSIRLANEGVWEARTGSNVLPVRTTLTRE